MLILSNPFPSAGRKEVLLENMFVGVSVGNELKWQMRQWVSKLHSGIDLIRYQLN